MHSVYRHVALIGKYQTGSSTSGTPSARTVLEDLAHFLTRCGCEVAIEQSTAHHHGLVRHDPQLTLDEVGRQCDLAIVVGGDGTMLGAGRQLAAHGVPLVGINQGRLGFVTDIPLDQYPQVLGPILLGQHIEDRRQLIQATVWRDERVVFDALAMNEVVVYRGGTSGMVELRVEVDGHFVANQRADGLILSTPTGSTAYALSAGGPLLHPSVPGLLLAPIAPHTLSNRPIVLPDSAVVAVEVVAGRDASANFDMQSLATLLHGDRIVVQRSRHSARFLHPVGWSYFDTLRRKLRWNDGS